jgi:hypothetical protein
MDRGSRDGGVIVMAEIRPLSPCVKRANADRPIIKFDLEGSRRGKVGSFSIVVRAGAEAEGFNDAFFRFLELNCRLWTEFEERSCGLQSTPLGAHEQKVVCLWSDEAVGQFVVFWRSRERQRRPA